MELQNVETAPEMVEWLKTYAADHLTAATVRGICEASWSYGHEISEDEVMCILGISE